MGIFASNARKPLYATNGIYNYIVSIISSNNVYYHYKKKLLCNSYDIPWQKASDWINIAQSRNKQPTSSSN